jgi:hypothetical protein
MKCAHEAADRTALKQLHRPEQQFEFHPICPVCTQTSE